MAVKKDTRSLEERLGAKLKALESNTEGDDTPASKEKVDAARRAGGNLADPHMDDLYDPDHEIPYAKE